MDFTRLLAVLLVNTPSAVVLLLFISVGDCLWPISLSACHAWMDSRQLIKRAPILASSAEDMTDLIVFVMVMMAPLFSGMAELLDMKKCLPALLHYFPPNGYEASLWSSRTMLLALYVMIASG